MDRLRPLWDFQDIELSERNLRAQLEREPDDMGRAEVLTQLARVAGLRDDFDAGDRLLDEAAENDAEIVQIRVLLERGRLRRSAGDTAAALPLFVAAFERAGRGFIAGDAAHMAAISTDDPREWTTRGLDLAERDPGASYWRATLLNNLGWWHQERGAHAEALEAFERALAAREGGPATPAQLAHARDAVATAREALRAGDADA